MVWNKTNGVEQDKWCGTSQMVWNKSNGVEQDKWYGISQMVHGTRYGINQNVWNIPKKPGTKRKRVYNNMEKGWNKKNCVEKIKDLEQYKRLGTNQEDWNNNI